MITGLSVVAIAIPALCWLTWRRNADGARDEGHPSFRDWAVGEFDTLTGPVKGANATAEVLLPIAAVAVGMTVRRPTETDPLRKVTPATLRAMTEAPRPLPQGIRQANEGSLSFDPCCGAASSWVH